MPQHLGNAPSRIRGGGDLHFVLEGRGFNPAVTELVEKGL
jgi:hypothetical protein